jgi:putative membrane protein
MRALLWLFRAFLFFVLFAFALNNQHEVVLHWFLGLETRTPMVLLVLGAFAMGAVFGVLAMLPNWWKTHRKAAKLASQLTPEPQAKPVVSTAVPEPLPPPPDGI